MTNDYKEKLLKYLTGNITDEPNSNIPFYEATGYYENNDLTNIGYSTYYVIDTIYCKDAKGNYTGNMLVYGNGTNNQTNWYGFIILVDNEFKVLKVFKEYSSGTKFSIFEKLNIDEIGQVYGIDYSSNKHRIILLNNISEKGNSADYKCVLRQSYFIQGNVQNTPIVIGSQGINSSILCIEKSKQSALYFMAGTTYEGNLYACSFKINVGESNEWTEYTDGVIYQGIFIDRYVYFDVDDNISCNFFFEEVNALDDTHEITNTYNVGTALTGYKKLVKNLEQYIDTIHNVRGIAINKEKIYVGIGGSDSISGLALVKVVLYDNGNITLAYTKQDYNGYVMPGDVRFAMINNQVFMVAFIGDDYSNGQIIGKLYSNLLSDDNIDYEYYLNVYKAYYNDINNGTNFFFGVSNNFNLYKMLVSYQGVGEQDINTFSTTIIHRNGYNGWGKENKYSLLPTQCLVYNIHYWPVFARDLYNYKVYNNHSVSVLNIPNTFVNGVELWRKELISDTNIILVQDDQTIFKNIYEDLYINFNNQITMQNQNETNYVDNLEGAIRLNQSSGKVLDYDSAKANKIRVTYTDETSYVTMVSNSISDNVCTYTIGVHVPISKNIKSIEIISNDENTTYQKITNLNLDNNKYYVITQDVHVV